MTGASITPGQRVRVALRDDTWFFWRSALVLQPRLPDGLVAVIVPGELLPRALRPEQIYVGAFGVGLLCLEPPTVGRS